MKIIKLLIAIAILLSILSIFLPQEYSVTRSLAMRAPISAISQHVTDFGDWEKWAVWEESEPPSGISLAAMDSGLGSGLYLSSLGLTGWFVISDDSSVDGFGYTVFSDSSDTSKANIIFFDEGALTKVSWTVKGKVTKPPVLASYIALSKEFLIGSAMSKSLSNLKSLVEQEDRK